MKGLWKSVKQTTTIAIGKLSSDPSDEDPEYRSKSDTLLLIDQNTSQLLKTLHLYRETLERHAASRLEVSTAFAKAFTEQERPHFDEAATLQTSATEYSAACTNVHQTHIPAFCIRELNDFREHIRALKEIKSVRKDNRILMQNEERKFKEAQEKHAKDVAHREARFNEHKTEYERVHADFLAGVERLAREKAEVFGRVFYRFQAFQIDLAEMEQRTVVAPCARLSLAAVRDELPRAMSKLDLSAIENFGALLTFEPDP
jgi:hypothetical protein